MREGKPTRKSGYNKTNKQGADPARRAAAVALYKMHGGAFANLAAKEVFAKAGLSGRDTAFATRLFYGTAERLVTLDALLAPYLKRPAARLDAEVRAILETGLYQLLFMEVPVSAAVNEAVKLTRALGKSSASGLVNAVLRRAVRELDAGAGKPFAPAVLPFADETERVSLCFSVSRPVAKAVMQALPGEYDAFFETTFASPELCLRANTQRNTAGALVEALENEGAEARLGRVPGAVYAKLPTAVQADPLHKGGAYHVQGEASQYACAQVDARPGMKVLDLCAAPGGKSATLAQQLGGPAGAGSSLVACDLHSHRVALIEANFKRLGIAGAECLVNDASVYRAEFENRFDRVLCDVPCSGLGVLGKKPDLRLSNGASFGSLPALQLKILQTAARYLKKGGALVYATCTIRCEENEEVVRNFLQNADDFMTEPPRFTVENSVERENMVTLLPHQTGLDGFFVARLHKI